MTRNISPWLKRDRPFPIGLSVKLSSSDNFVLVEAIRWQVARFCRRRMCRTIFFVLAARKKISRSSVIPYSPSCKLIKLVIAKVVFSQLDPNLLKRKREKKTSFWGRKERNETLSFLDLIFSATISEKYSWITFH